MSSIRRTLRRVITAALLISGVALLWGVVHVRDYLNTPIAPEGGLRTVIIPKGANLDRILGKLQGMGVVRDRTVFEYYVRSKGMGTDIRAGVYRIDLRSTPKELLKTLVIGGGGDEIAVTVPEGYNKWQIADTLASVGLVKRDAFLAKIDAEGLEGMLFPDTYRFGRSWSLDRITQTMVDRFDAVYIELLKGHPRAKSLTQSTARHHLVTLASLIEKEARTDRDRKLVSRVFQNRLTKNMKLQTDPTCVYGPKIYKRTPSPALCHATGSQYSTYVIKGMPPTPIANPGRAALAAALEPAVGPQAAKYLYFVARRDGSGEHDFSETYAEHKKAVSKYLKKGRSSP
jgi:UPF0755 protein